MSLLIVGTEVFVDGTRGLGLTIAHVAECCTVGKQLTSAPISAMISSAGRFPTPVIVSARSHTGHPKRDPASSSAYQIGLQMARRAVARIPIGQGVAGENPVGEPDPVAGPWLTERLPICHSGNPSRIASASPPLPRLELQGPRAGSRPVECSGPELKGRSRLSWAFGFRVLA